MKISRQLINIGPIFKMAALNSKMAAKINIKSENYSLTVYKVMKNSHIDMYGSNYSPVNTFSSNNSLQFIMRVKMGKNNGGGGGN